MKNESKQNEVTERVSENSDDHELSKVSEA